MPNNRNRAQWAETALRAFARQTGQLTGGDWEYDRESVITDLIADLMHYCEAKGIDFDERLDSGRNHFHCEGGNGHAKDDIAQGEDEIDGEEATP